MCSHEIQAPEYENFFVQKVIITHICSGLSKNSFVWAFFGSFRRFNDHLKNVSERN